MMIEQYAQKKCQVKLNVLVRICAELGCRDDGVSPSSYCVREYVRVGADAM